MSINAMAQERISLSHSFGPFVRPESRLLILGSFPSVKSREAQFYYGHPQNRFWPLMAGLCAEPVPVTREEKEALLIRHRIALYDVIESCTIIGSSDSSIEDVVVTDLAPLVAVSRIGTSIFTNGAKAYQLYMKYTYPALGIPALKLPSTSPANAAFSLERLTQEWRALLPQDLEESI